MQKTQGTPQPQDPQTHNPQNNSSSDNTYESTPVSSTAPADNNRLVIDEDEQDEHNVKKTFFVTTPMTPVKKLTDNADDSDNWNDEDDFDLNSPKTFNESSEDNDPAPDKQQTRRYNQTVTVVLPTTEQMLSLQK